MSGLWLGFEYTRMFSIKKYNSTIFIKSPTNIYHYDSY